MNTIKIVPKSIDTNHTKQIIKYLNSVIDSYSQNAQSTSNKALCHLPDNTSLIVCC